MKPRYDHEHCVSDFDLDALGRLADRLDAKAAALDAVTTKAYAAFGDGSPLPDPALLSAVVEMQGAASDLRKMVERVKAQEATDAR